MLRKIYFLLLLYSLVVYKSYCQTIKVTGFSPGSTYDTEAGNNEYMFNFGIENTKINCYEIQGAPSHITGVAYGYGLDMGSYTNSDGVINISLESWEDDGCKDRCSYNTGCWFDNDEKYCESSNQQFKFSDYAPILKHKAELVFCNGLSRVRFDFTWMPPLLKFLDFNQIDYCGNKDVITLKCVETVFKGKYLWEYNDGSGWKYISITAEPICSFLAFQYTQITSVKFRVSPYIQNTVCQSTETTLPIYILPPPPTNVAFKVNNILCHGENTGSVAISDITGFYDTYLLALRKVGGETFNIPNHPKTGTTNTFNNLTPGSYFLRILNNIYQNGALKEICSLEIPLTITEPATKVAFASTPYRASNRNGFAISCAGLSDGLIRLSASGGTGALSYSINGGKDFVNNSYFANLKAGNYTLQVRDENNCSPTPIPITLTEPPKLAARAIPKEYYANIHTKCSYSNDGQITLAIRGGVAPYGTALNGNNIEKDRIIYENLGSGTYQTRVIDANGCSLDGSFTLNSAPAITFSDLKLISPQCFGESNGKISLNIFGGLVFTQDGRKTNISDDQGNTYQFNTTNINLENIKKGIYTIQTTDYYNCKKDTQLVLTQPEVLRAETTIKEITCKGNTDGYFLFTPQGGTAGYSHKVLSQSTNQEIQDIYPAGYGYIVPQLAAGQYQIQLQDTNGCKPSKPIVIEIKEPAQKLSLAITEAVAPTCYGNKDGSIKLEATGGWQNYSYSSNKTVYTTSKQFAQLPSRVYTFYVQDDKNCTDSLSFKLNQPAPFTLSPKEIFPVLCYGEATGAIALTANGGTKPYQFSTQSLSNYQSDSTLKRLKKGTYTLYAKDANGCATSTTGSIGEPSPLKLEIINLTSATCNKSNGAISLKGTGGVSGYRYRWQQFPQETLPNISGIKSGRYQVQLEDKNQCRDSLSIFVNDEDGPKAIQKTAISTTCSYSSDGAASIEASAGHPPYTYYWPIKDNKAISTDATNLKGGDYLVEIEDSKTCKVAVWVTVPSPPVLELKADSLLHPICDKDCNGSLVLQSTGGNGKYSYKYNNENLPKNRLQGLCAGKYIIEAQDLKNCQTSDTFELVNPSLKLQLPDSTIICKGQTVKVDAGLEEMSYDWTSDVGFTSKSKMVNLKEGGNYYLKIIDSKGCEAKDTLKVVTSTKLLEAHFLMSGKALAYDTIGLVEYSWPIPEKTTWEIPQEFKKIKEGNDWYYFQVGSPGVYKIKLKVALGECMDELEKEILVYPPSSSDSLGGYRLGFSGILSTKLFPNPNEGKFKIAIELSETEKLELKVHHLLLGPALYELSQEGSSKYEMDVQLMNLSSGAYYLTVKTPSDYKIVKFLVY